MSHIILFLLLFSSLMATDISAKYKVTFGIFGEIGIGYTNFYIDEKNNYKVTVHAKSTGLANFLSGQREEWHVSSGIVTQNGILIPSYYEKIVQRYLNDDNLDSGYAVLKKDIKKYIFFHDKKELKIEQTKYNGDKVTHEIKKGDYYAPNDLLSLFFNFKNMLPSLDIKTPSKFYAVGVNKTDGKIDVKPIENTVNMKEDFGWKDGHMMKIIINEDIFTNDNDGELLVNLDNDGLLIQAVLKDVFFFGDIRGELID